MSSLRHYSYSSVSHTHPLSSSFIKLPHSFFVIPHSLSLFICKLNLFVVLSMGKQFEYVVIQSNLEKSENKTIEFFGLCPGLDLYMARVWYKMMERLFTYLLIMFINRFFNFQSFEVYSKILFFHVGPQYWTTYYSGEWVINDDIK